ncbi:alpha/beta hydrolase fold domain-containing protein [Mesotoga sp.]|uniref:alpha/beta hydrolase fold domain-containing protein n=1 Tax=Mesotoga sp. TaxID=2053577 RepID=UPI00345EDD54
MSPTRKTQIIVVFCLVCSVGLADSPFSEIRAFADLVEQLFLASRSSESFDLKNLDVDSYGRPAIDYRFEEDVIYSRAGGETLTMDIFTPNDIDTPRPGILYVHGGAWITGDKRSGPGVVIVSELIRAGFIVFSIDYRLAPKWKFPSQVIDVKTAVRFVRKHSSELMIDPGRIGAFGTSAGAHLVALAALTADKGLFSSDEFSDQSEELICVADLYGPTDLEALFTGIKKELVDLIFGSEEDVLKKASPISYVRSDSPSFLIVQGDKDAVVPPYQSVRLFEKLLDKGCSAELIIVENAGHGLVPDGGEMRPSMMEVAEKVVHFFKSALSNQ